MGVKRIHQYLLALVAMLLFLTTAQAMEGPLTAFGEDPRVAKRQVGFTDDGPESVAAHQKVDAKWKNDVRWAKQHGLRVVEEAPPSPNPARRQKRNLVPSTGQFVYFPSGGATDAKMLALAGTVRTNTNATSIRIKLAAPSAAPNIQIGIFDGDTGGKWDAVGSQTRYTLYEDPLSNGAGTVVANGGAAIWTSDGSSGANVGSPMPDNAWFNVTVPTAAGAQNSSGNGNYFYYLKCELVTPASSALNAFKIRTTASVRLEPQNSFNFVGSLFNSGDLPIIYPSYPSLTPTNYDGNWDLWTYVPTSATYFEVWDGDFDFGDSAGTVKDTDDPNTPNNVLPAWALSNTHFEGVAVGTSTSTGSPPDDYVAASFRRSPCINYDVTDPNGFRYSNSNPSGNLEWERFRIDTTTSDPSVTDYTAGELPAGIYQIHINGMDLGNLDSLRLDYDMLGVDINGNPVAPILPYNIGDTVFLDNNGNGVQDAGEPGIAGVKLNILDDKGFFLASVTTDSNGHYNYGVDSGTYIVSVDPSNLQAGGALNGLFCTTGSALQRTVTTANDLTYDFGYEPASNGFLGGVVWLDQDSSATRNNKEPGIGGVTVRLFSSGTEIANTLTDVNGAYLFTGVTSGNYDILVDSTTLPSGLTQTYDKDGLSTAHTNNLDFVQSTPSMDNNFGYVGSGKLGRIVFVDTNNNGALDSTDVGIGGVRMVLSADFNGDGITDFVTDTTTDGSGAYLFSNLPGATYTVKVDTQTLPYGLTLVYDPDGTATPDRSTTVLAAGATNLLQNFGYLGLGKIGDFVWQDTNGNGVQDSGEPGIAGVKVTISGDFNNDGIADYTASTTTDANGLYAFDKLPAGYYTVSVDKTTLPSTSIWTQTYDLDGTATPNKASLNLPPRTTNLSVDFGYQNSGVTPGALSGTVWSDADADGSIGMSETLLSGITVKLCDSNGNLLGTTTTNGGGFYSFSGLATGNYTVKVDTTTLPAGLTAPTYDYDGTATPNSAVAAVTAPNTTANVNFGYVQGATVGDYVWNDTNANGIQDSGESGLSGVTVQLYNSSNALIATTTTSSSGAYQFTNLIPGSYYVQFSLTGYSVSPQTQGTDTTKDSNPDPTTGQTSTFALTAGQTDLTIDAGLYQPVSNSSSVGDFVWKDTNANGVQDSGELGISGVTVQLYTSSNSSLVSTTTTDGNGKYLFANLAAGSYYIVVTAPSGYTYSPTGAGTTSTDNNFDSNGIYQFTLAASTTDLTIDAGLYQPLGSLSGTVWKDLNSNSTIDDGAGTLISGVPIALTLKGQTVGTTTTDSNGFYQFTNLATGNYTVTVNSAQLPSGFTSPTYDYDGTGTPNTALATVSGSAATDHVDFGYNGSPVSIGDFVWNDANSNGTQDSGETGISGVTVQLYQIVTPSGQTGGANLYATTTTGANGAYLFSNVPAARSATSTVPGISYYVKVVPPTGYEFSTTSAGAAIGSAGQSNTSKTDKTGTMATISPTTNDLTQDSGLHLIPTLATIGDRVWLDTNTNGIQDSGETGVSGVTVTLFNTSNVQVSAANLVNPTTTDANGNYIFQNVPAAVAGTSYYVKFTLPSGFSTTTQAVGTNRAIDSNVDSTGKTATFTVVAGQTETTIDAGIYPTFYTTSPATLDGYVFLDQNRDGIFSKAVEAGFNLVTVKLYNSTNSLVATVQTNSSGFFNFGTVTPGSYTVKVDRTTLTAGTTWLETTPYHDSNPPVTNAGQDVFTVTIAAGDQNHDPIFGYAAQPYVNTGAHYTTYTQGGWGNTKGTPGLLLANNFVKVYRSGSMGIGRVNYTGTGHGNAKWSAYFTSAQAIDNFMPTGGTAAQFTQDYTNPLTSSAGVLAGQLMAAQLSMDFSAAGILPAPGGKVLGALLYQNGTGTMAGFNGMTVTAILQAADLAIAGDTSGLPSGAGISDLNTVLTNINQNYDNGTVDNGFLH